MKDTTSAKKPEVCHRCSARNMHFPICCRFAHAARVRLGAQGGQGSRCLIRRGVDHSWCCGPKLLCIMERSFSQCVHSSRCAVCVCLRGWKIPHSVCRSTSLNQVCCTRHGRCALDLLLSPRGRCFPIRASRVLEGSRVFCMIFAGNWYLRLQRGIAQIFLTRSILLCSRSALISLLCTCRHAA